MYWVVHWTWSAWSAYHANRPKLCDPDTHTFQSDLTGNIAWPLWPERRKIYYLSDHQARGKEFA